MNNSYNQTLFNNNKDNFNIKDSYNIISNYTTNNYTPISDERPRILSWISPLESCKRHRDVASARAEGVGKWVLQSHQFLAWRDRGNGQSVGAILFCFGVPGAGKTFVCSLVIDELCSGAPGPNVLVGYVYCDYRARGQHEQTPDVMIRSLLRQFVERLPEIPEAITQAFRAAKTHPGGQALELAKIFGLFRAVLVHFQQVFICVDGLDELVAQHRSLFLRSLRQILDESPNTRLFLTARPHIESDLKTNIPPNTGTITIQPRPEDIEGYLAKKLDADQHPREMDVTLRSEIMTTIPKKASEIFLLATLLIDSVLREITIGGRRKKLQEMTNGLGNAYAITLERIRGQDRALARCGIFALMWISLAERPVLVDELRHALAMEEGGSSNIDPEMVPSIDTVVSSCMGLVTIDHASSTVRLVHATLEEHLRKHQENVFQNPHATIATVCLNYLNIPSVRKLPSDLKTAHPAFPLLAYASCYWGTHARRDLTASVKNLALGILDQYPQHAAANIFLFNGGAPRCLWRSSARFSGLHYVAYFGIDGLLEELLSMGGVDLNQPDGWGRTPLILAAEKGNKGAVQALLSRADVDPNLADLDDQTPLFLASVNGHKEAVRILLNRADVNPNSTDLYGRTPLLLASTVGNEEIIKILLSHADVNPNSTDLYGRTPLFLASSDGHEEVVRILLDCPDVNPNSADRDDQTPLFRASANGHEGVVRALLRRGNTNPNAADWSGQTPLSRASANGHKGVVRILLSHSNVNPNLANQGD